MAYQQQLQLCVVVILIVLQAATGTPLRLQSGATCQLPAEIPDNHHGCYKLSISEETVGHREVESEVLQLVKPCPSCFPEVQTVRRVWQVPVVEEQCTLSPLWRKPRAVPHTATGTRILTSRGLLRGTSYPNNLLCVWSISCGSGEALYFNISQQDLHVAEQHRGLEEGHASGNHTCSDYIQVTSDGNTSVVSCGEQPHPQTVDQVQYDGRIQVVFRSDESGNANGAEVDTACFPLDPVLRDGGGASSMDELLSTSCEGSAENSTSAQYDFLSDLFRLHYRLLSVTDACSRGVTKCVNADFIALAGYLRGAMEQARQFEVVCNPVLQSLMEQTFSLLQDHI